MKYTPPKFDKFSEMASIDVGRLTENEARKILEDIRWPEGIVCSHCGSMNIVRIHGKTDKVRDGLLRCKDCRKQFTVTVGTVMEDSHITLRQWIQAFHSMSSHKKGVSALQLQRNLGLHSYRSAWHLSHRIRLAMKEGPFASALKGVIEVDETYIGGRPKKVDNKENKRGRGTKKTPVLAMIERNGRARTRVVNRVNAKELKNAIRENVNKDSAIMTDEFKSYNGIGNEFEGGHKVVEHSKGQYVTGENNEIHVNTDESFFALLKRGVHGTFHHISKEHLNRYCDEFSFRWNNRKLTDGERATQAINGMVGKRLTYNELSGGNRQL
jgi:transposase-like protein